MENYGINKNIGVYVQQHTHRIHMTRNNVHVATIGREKEKDRIRTAYAIWKIIGGGQRKTKPKDNAQYTMQLQNNAVNERKKNNNFPALIHGVTEVEYAAEYSFTTIREEKEWEHLWYNNLANFCSYQV